MAAISEIKREGAEREMAALEREAAMMRAIAEMVGGGTNGGYNGGLYEVKSHSAVRTSQATKEDRDQDGARGATKESGGRRVTRGSGRQLRGSPDLEYDPGELKC